MNGKGINKHESLNIRLSDYNPDDDVEDWAEDDDWDDEVDDDFDENDEAKEGNWEDGEWSEEDRN